MLRKVGPLALFLAVSLLFPVLARAQFIGCKNILQITEEECEVLEKLFIETDGIFWFNNQGWLRTNQPCDWFGVTCASTAWPRPVTKIELISNNVGGSLPPDLSLLSQLKELVIENRDAVSQFKKLSGDIPSVLGDLSALEVLRLSRNDLRGEIPANLTKLSKLRILHLDDNALSGFIPQALGALGPLEELDLSSNDFFGTIPPELGNLNALKHLNLGANTLEGTIPETLGNLNNLISINLHDNNLSGTIPGTLNNFPHLLWLSFSDNNLDGPLSLDIATSLAEVNTCFLTNNAPGLCIPDTPAFRALGADPICGLPLSATCSSPFLVEILSFEAAIEADAVLLNWTTDRGSVDSRFEVEQKREETFEMIGLVEGRGSADQGQAYTFRVLNPGRSPYTFRLKQVDPSGTFVYSTEVTVLAIPEAYVVEPAFPNPFRRTTTLRFAMATAQPVVAALYNTMGQRVRTLYAGTPPANTTQSLRIDAVGLSGGLYFVRITGADGLSTTETIQVVK